MQIEFGSSPPSCPLLPWHKSELRTCPSWNLGSTLPCVKFQQNKGAEPVSCRRPPRKVTKRQKKVKLNSLKIQDQTFLSIPMHSTVQHTFCKYILTMPLLMLPCAPSGLYLTFHNRSDSTLDPVKQISFFLFIYACH